MLLVPLPNEDMSNHVSGSFLYSVEGDKCWNVAGSRAGYVGCLALLWTGRFLCLCLDEYWYCSHYDVRMCLQSGDIRGMLQRPFVLSHCCSGVDTDFQYGYHVFTLTWICKLMVLCYHGRIWLEESIALVKFLITLLYTVACLWVTLKHGLYLLSLP